VQLQSSFSARLKEVAVNVFKSKFSMTQLRVVLVATVLVFVFSGFGSVTWGQPIPVYVSGGPFIYQVNGSSLTTILKKAGSNFASLAIGPDNVDLDAHGNALHPFLIYACDIKTNTIIRFDPSNPSVRDTVYNASVSGLTPVCGRSTSAGDFYVTNQAASGTGGNVYKFANLANVGLGLLTPQIPVAVALGLPATFTGAGITQKTVGDLLLVDTADNEVFRSSYGAPFGAATPYIGASLNSPKGIARLSTGEVFVANSGSSNIAHFDRTGAVAATCPTLTFPTGAGASKNTRLFFLTASETDKIYAATSTSTSDYTEDQDYVPEKNDPGQVWTWSPTQVGCTLQSVAQSQTLLSGIVVSPIPTASITEPLTATVASPTPITFNFNSSAFQVIANGCSATVTAFPLNLATVVTAIGLSSNSGLPDGATPLANLGEGGYEIAYVATYPLPSTGPCQSVFSDGTFANAIFGLYDSSLATNPRLVQCDSSAAGDISNEPLLGGTTACKALTTIGSYPLGGIIPTDQGTIGKSRGNSVFILVNAKFASAANGGNAQFCGFFSPLKNTTNPAQAATFDSDDIVPIVFRLATATGNCNSGPFINNASALLSIAQIADSTGAPVFNPLFSPQTLFNQGAIFPNVASFYTLYLPVHANQLAVGTYSLSVLFETDNTSQQTIVFKVVPGI
jgi:hypothetical protein